MCLIVQKEIKDTIKQLQLSAFNKLNYRCINMRKDFEVPAYFFQHSQTGDAICEFTKLYFISQLFRELNYILETLIRQKRQI